MAPPAAEIISNNNRKEYKKLLDTLDKAIRKKELEKMVFLAGVPAGDAEKLDKSFKLFSYMEGNDVLNESNTDELLELLDGASRRDLKKRVLEYQEKIKTNKEDIQGGCVQNSCLDTYEHEEKKEKNQATTTKQEMSFPNVNKLDINVKEAQQQKAAEESLGDPPIYKSPGPCESMDAFMPLVSQNSYVQGQSSYVDSNGQEIYKMESNPRGICVIMSNSKFNDARFKPRDGTKIDVQNLKSTFENLLFQIDVCEELTAQEMYLKLNYYAVGYDHSHYDCFACIILSHGNEHGVFGIKGENVDITHLTGMFEHTPSLKCKPKLFFFQACRGITNAREPVHTKDDDGDFDGFSNFARAHQSSPSNSDFFFGYATPPGYTAWLSKDYGSWYIHALCQAFNELAEKCDIHQIATKTNSLVSKFITDNRDKQIPSPAHTLTKNLLFFPCQRKVI